MMRMSDEKLQESMLHNTAELIRRFPQIAVEAAGNWAGR
jgi:hypothetical protein